jgi:hypothetical protein
VRVDSKVRLIKVDEDGDGQDRVGMQIARSNQEACVRMGDKEY